MAVVELITQATTMTVGALPESIVLVLLAVFFFALSAIVTATGRATSKPRREHRPLLATPLQRERE
jgi:hypothetical protein